MIMNSFVLSHVYKFRVHTVFYMIILRLFIVSFHSQILHDLISIASAITRDLQLLAFGVEGNYLREFMLSLVVIVSTSIEYWAGKQVSTRYKMEHFLNFVAFILVCGISLMWNAIGGACANGPAPSPISNMPPNMLTYPSYSYQSFEGWF